MHLAAKTTLQLTWVLPVKRLKIIRSRYSTATILRTRNPFPHATLPSPSSYHSPLVSSRSSPAPRSELSPLSRDVPFALTARVQVGRSTRMVSGKRTRASRQKHAHGEREAHSCKALQRASTTDHGTPVNAHRQPSTEDLDQQWRGVLFALTARVQIGSHTRQVSAKRTLSQDSRTNERHRPRGGLKDAQGACRRDRSIKRGRGCIDKQWRSVPFALTAQPKIGRNTHPVSAKGTMVDIGGRWRLSESFEAPR